MIGQLCSGHMGDTGAGVGSYSLGHGLLDGGSLVDIGGCVDESGLVFWEDLLNLIHGGLGSGLCQCTEV